MKYQIEERVIQLANFILENKATVRSAAKHFGVSKSTVHKDVTDRLHTINLTLAQETRKVLEQNKAERHIRGGEATKAKFHKDEVLANT